MAGASISKTKIARACTMCRILRSEHLRLIMRASDSLPSRTTRDHHPKAATTFIASFGAGDPQRTDLDHHLLLSEGSPFPAALIFPGCDEYS